MPEKGAKEVLYGYPKVARLMGPHPEVAIFRRFGSLTMLNLMKLQAELLVIENDLNKLRISNDESVDPELCLFSKNFQKLNNSQAPNNGQRLLLDESLQKLDQYNRLLLQAAEVAKLGRPSKDRLNFFRKWLIGETEGNNFQEDHLELLRTWDKDMTKDLVSLNNRNAQQGDFAKWFKPTIVTAYHWFLQHLRDPIEQETGMVYDYEDSSILKWGEYIVVLLTTTIASLLPALVILWLSNVADTATRIYITIGFTGGIGILMKMVTNAKMKDILAVTVAFAAVEVVFIGSTNQQNLSEAFSSPYTKHLLTNCTNP